MHFWILCVVFTPRWKDSLISFCFFLFFFGKVLFVLWFVKKLQSALQCIWEVIRPFDLSTWTNHMIRNDRHLHQNVCYPYSLETMTLPSTKRYRCSMSHNLSERNGFAFSARKKTVFEILKTLKIFLKTYCLKMHKTTCNGLVYLFVCQKVKVKDHSDNIIMLYDHYLFHISLKKLSSTILKAEMLPWPIDLEIFFALKCMINLMQE